MPITQEKPKATMQEQPGKQRKPGTDKTLGIVEMVAGVLLIPFSYVAGAFLGLFLGIAVALSGILQLVEGVNQRITGKQVIGVLGIIAGLFVMFNPAIALTLVGGYLIISGLVHITTARKDNTGTTPGIIEIVLGVIALSSVSVIGWMVGLYLIIRGLITYRAGARASRTA